MILYYIYLKIFNFLLSQLLIFYNLNFLLLLFYLIVNKLVHIFYNSEIRVHMLKLIGFQFLLLFLNIYCHLINISELNFKSLLSSYMILYSFDKLIIEKER